MTDLRTPAQERRDFNPTHFLQSAKIHKQAYQDYLSQYENPILLSWLCTLPNFRRRGAGVLLCKWGLDLAKMEGCAAAVMASEMGKPLYESVGFEVKGKFVVRIDGEDEKLEKWAMVCVCE